jgi:hypothetical protein
MSERTLSENRSVYQSLSRGLARVAAWQWRLLDAQYQAGLELVAALSPGAVPVEERGPRPPAPRAEELKDLERRAAERVSKGLPPPKEIYDVHNRSRIDWSKFPEWARPVDPEVFEGCSHEG